MRTRDKTDDRGKCAQRHDAMAPFAARVDLRTISSGVFILVLCNPGNQRLAFALRFSGDCGLALNRFSPLSFS